MKNLTKDEMGKLEDLVDDYFQNIDLPLPKRAISIWYIGTVIEDILRLVITKCEYENSKDLMQCFYDLTIRSDNMKYVHKTILQWLMNRLGFDTLKFRPIIAGEVYATFERLIRDALIYNHVSRDIADYHSGFKDCIFIGDGRYIFRRKIDDVKYDALDILSASMGINGFPMHAFFALNVFEDLSRVPDDMKNVALSASVENGGFIKYRYNTRIAKELDSYVSSLAKTESLIPNSWVFPWGDSLKVRSILRALQIRCLYHLICVHFGAVRNNIEGMGVESLYMIIRTPELMSDISDFVGLKKSDIQETFDHLIYGYRVDTPDPALQPIVQINSKNVALACFQVCSSFMERNMLTLHSRLERNSFDSQSSIFESIMTDGIVNIAGTSGWQFVSNRRIAKEEVDVLFIDYKDKVLLVVELRWMLPAGDMREVTNRKEVLIRKIDQVERKVKRVRENIADACRLFGFGKTDSSGWTVFGCVVTEGFAGTIVGIQRGFPIIPKSAFIIGLSEENSLRRLSEWAISGTWLPVENTHYVKENVDVSFAEMKISSEIIIVKSSDQYWSDFVKQSIQSSKQT